jgi:hypothetical protein
MTMLEGTWSMASSSAVKSAAVAFDNYRVVATVGLLPGARPSPGVERRGW